MLNRLATCLDDYFKDALFHIEMIINMNVARLHRTASILSSGNVLVVGERAIVMLYSILLNCIERSRPNGICVYIRQTKAV